MTLIKISKHFGLCLADNVEGKVLVLGGLSKNKTGGGTSADVIPLCHLVLIVLKW